MGSRGAFEDVTIGNFNFVDGGQTYKSVGEIDGIKVNGVSWVNDSYVLRVASKYRKYSHISGYDTDDIVYVVVPKDKVEGGRILEDDKVSVYGEYDGIETYTTILGGSVSIPRIEATRVVIK